MGHLGGNCGSRLLLIWEVVGSDELGRSNGCGGWLCHIAAAVDDLTELLKV